MNNIHDYRKGQAARISSTEGGPMLNNQRTRPIHPSHPAASHHGARVRIPGGYTNTGVRHGTIAEVRETTGRQAAFDREGNFVVYVVKLDGGGRERFHQADCEVDWGTGLLASLA